MEGAGFAIDVSRTPASETVTTQKATSTKFDGKKYRAEQRKLKRQAKSEAKKARKANIKPSAKWTPERKAEERAKKMANKPMKQEKKRLRLLSRSRKLEIEAHKLLAESKKAAALYEQLTKAKEQKEAEEKTEATNDDLKATRSNDNQDGDSDSESSSSASDSSESTGGAVVVDNVAAKVPADEVVMKQRRESDVGSRISLSPEPEKKQKSKKTKTKKVSAPADDMTTEEAAPAVKKPEEKQGKKKSKHDADDGALAKKDKKRKREDADEEQSSKQAKKDKKKKKSKGSETATVQDEVKEVSGADAKQWNVSELDGGAARQDKFLRLLGSKKARNGPHSTDGAASGVNKPNSIQAEADIQRQFEAGMKMKNAGGNHRRGLGA